MVRPHGGKEIHRHRELPTTPHKSPPHPNRQATTPATARATTQTQRHGGRMQKGTRPQHQGRGMTRWQRDRTGGDQTHLMSARVPHNEAGQSNQRRRHPTPEYRYDGPTTDHVTAKHGTTQSSTAHRSTTHRRAHYRDKAPHSTTQYSAIQRRGAQHGAARHATATHSTAQHRRTEQGAPQQGAEQPGAAQQSTAQHSTAHQSTPQHQTEGH